MPEAPIQIKRYPNRRYYARHTSKYVSLQAIEEMVKNGQTVQIRDSQSGEDLTRTVLTQIIMERQPDKLSLFPVDMMHFIVGSNDTMSDFLRDYFRHSLTYLDYLQRHSGATSLAAPMHWAKAWLDAISAKPEEKRETVALEAAGESEAIASSGTGETDTDLAQRIQELEERLQQLEAK